MWFFLFVLKNILTKYIILFSLKKNEIVKKGEGMPKIYSEEEKKHIIKVPFRNCGSV